MKKRTTAKWLAISAAFGGIVGAVTALVYAPKSGSAFRKDLKKQYKIGKDLADEHIKKAFAAVSPEVEEAYEEYKEAINERLQAWKKPLTKEAYDDMVDAVTNQLASNRKELQRGYDVLKKEWKKMYRRIAKKL